MDDIRALIPTRKPGASAEAITETENALGATFPAQYRELVKLVNAAEVADWTFHPVKNPHSIAKTWDDIVRNNRDPKARWPNMSEEWVAFADNGTGDKLCFKIVNGRMDDAVYWWDHELGEAHLQAATLREFILDPSTK